MKIARNLENAELYSFTRTISHIDHPLPLLRFSPSPPTAHSSSLFSPHCIPVMTNVKHSPLGGCFFFLVTKSLPSRMCAGTRLLRKHHIRASASDISVKVTEMFEGVVTSSQVPAVCVHQREMAPSHPFCLHPPIVVFKLISLFSCYHFYCG